MKERFLPQAVLFFCILLSHGNCFPSDFVVAIDTGHSRAKPGAVSSRGVGEYQFNSNMAGMIVRRLDRMPSIKALSIDRTGDDLSLAARSDAANAGKADLLLSIHHDSVQPHYLSPWTFNGKPNKYCDRFSGYSLFVSRKNSRFEDSLKVANMVGSGLLKSGFHPTLHHAERIRGENRELLDKEKGIYEYGELVVLKRATMPAVLLECGIIVNRDEEERLGNPALQHKMVEAVCNAIAVCGSSLTRSSKMR